MKITFLTAMALVAFALPASAQLPGFPTPASSGTCASGQCPRVQAAITQVRSAGADVVHRVGDVIAPPVQGVWSVPAQPWYPALPASAPQVMAAPKRNPIFPRLHHLVTGK